MNLTLQRRRRRWSMEETPAFSDLLKKLPKYSASFIRAFDRKKVRMRRIAYGLQKVAAQVKHMKEKSKTLKVTALLCAAAIGSVAAAAGGFSFTAFAAAALAAVGLATAFVFTRKQLRGQRGSRKQVKEFLKIVDLLRSELEEVKKVCEDLQRESVGAEMGNTARLKDDIDNLLDVTAKLKTSVTSHCVSDISAQFKNTVKEFEKMRRRLKDLRERRDAENPQWTQC